VTINGDPRRLSRRSKDELSLKVLLTEPVADPDLELRGRGERRFVLLALPAFLPSLISSLFTQNKGEPSRGPRASPLDPPLKHMLFTLKFIYQFFHSISRIK